MTQVTHVPEQDRFTAGDAVLTYRLTGDGAVVLEHTVVPPQDEGRGIGSALTRAALDWAMAQDLEVVPQCSFVAAWLQRHPDHGVRVR